MVLTQLSYKWLFSQFKFIREQAKRHHLIKGTGYLKKAKSVQSICLFTHFRDGSSFVKMSRSSVKFFVDLETRVNSFSSFLFEILIESLGSVTFLIISTFYQVLNEIRFNCISQPL